MISVYVHVCTAYGADDPNLQNGWAPTGKTLFHRLTAAAEQVPHIEIVPVDCLAVCDRPATIAFQGFGKWSYTIGDVDPDNDIDDILAAADAVAASEHGVSAMIDRPPFFRLGVVSRLPPIPASK